MDRLTESCMSLPIRGTLLGATALTAGYTLFWGVFWLAGGFDLQDGTLELDHLIVHPGSA